MGNIIDFSCIKDFKKKDKSSGNGGDGMLPGCPYTEKIEAKIMFLGQQIDNMKWILTLLITFLGILSAIFFSCLNSQFGAIDKSIDAYQKKVDTKFELIQQQLNSQKEINQIQIQRDVSQEINKNKK